MRDNPPAATGFESSRRQFIKKSSAVLAGGTLAGGLSMARFAHAAGDDLIRIALVGCGGRGGGATTQALKTKGNVKLVAMADAFRDNLEGKLRGFKAQFPARVDVPKQRQFVGFDAYQKVLDAGVDLVILATPPGFRPIHFEAAVKAGKNIFMEKPVAVDGPGIRRVLAAAELSKRKGLAVGVGLQRHHQRKYIETIKRLQDGAIGDIHLLRAYWDGTTPWVRRRKPNQTEMEYQMRNWYFFVWLCGDHIVEQHVHNLDVCNWLRGAYPVSANGMGGRRLRTGKDHGQIFDHHFVEFTYADGTKLYSQCRQMKGCWNHVDEHAHGSKGTADIGRGVIEGPAAWRASGPAPDPYQVEHNDLFAAVRNGTPYNEAEYGAKSTMTAILGRMATYSGKIVTWDQALNSKVDQMPKQFAFDADPPALPDADGNYPIPVPSGPGIV